MSYTVPFSEACERNKDVILEVISPYLKEAECVLEIGSGTGQHALYFARQMPHLTWQTSDQQEYIEGVKAQLDNAAINADLVENILSPITLDVNQAVWDSQGRRYSAVYTANTFHIMRWSDVEAFFRRLPTVASKQAYLIVYGPFKYAGLFTSHSNEAFDQSLRSRGRGSGIRDFEAVDKLASQIGYELLADHKMPANNQCLIWRKVK